jgi:hypothetical protein
MAISERDVDAFLSSRKSGQDSRQSTSVGGMTEDDVDDILSRRRKPKVTPESDREPGTGTSLLRGFQDLKKSFELTKHQLGITDLSELAEAAGEYQGTKESLAQDPRTVETLEKVQNAEGFVDAALALWDNPSAIYDTFMESLPSSAPSMVIGGATSFVPYVGKFLGPALGGLTSGYTEYNSSIFQYAQEQGVDLKDKEAFIEFFSDEKKMEEATKYAAKRGIAIGGFEGISWVAGGMFMKPIAKAIEKTGLESQLLKTLGGLFGEATANIGYEMGGEATAQALTGEVSPGEVLLEGVAGAPGAPVEIGVGIYQAKKEADAQAKKEAEAEQLAEEELEPIIKGDPEMEKPEMVTELEDTGIEQTEEATPVETEETEYTQQGKKLYEDKIRPKKVEEEATKVAQEVGEAEAQQVLDGYYGAMEESANARAAKKKEEAPVEPEIERVDLEGEIGEGDVKSPKLVVKEEGKPVKIIDEDGEKKRQEVKPQPVEEAPAVEEVAEPEPVTEPVAEEKTYQEGDTLPVVDGESKREAYNEAYRKRGITRLTATDEQMAEISKEMQEDAVKLEEAADSLPNGTRVEFDDVSEVKGKKVTRKEVAEKIDGVWRRLDDKGDTTNFVAQPRGLGGGKVLGKDHRMPNEGPQKPTPVKEEPKTPDVLPPVKEEPKTEAKPVPEKLKKAEEAVEKKGKPPMASIPQKLKKADEKLPKGKKQPKIAERVVEKDHKGKPMKKPVRKSEKLIKKLYSVQSNKKSVANAIKYVEDEGLESAHDNFLSDSTELSEADRNTVGLVLLEYYNNNNQYKKTIAIAEKLSELGTSGGQAVQVLNMLGNALEKEESAIVYVQKQFDNIGKGVKSKPDVQSAMDVMSDMAGLSQEDDITTESLRDVSPNVSDALDRILSRLSKSAVEDPNTKGGVFSAEMVNDLSIVGAEIISMGFNKFSDWSKKMIEIFGDKVSNSLKIVWEKTSPEAIENALIEKLEKKLAKLKEIESGTFPREKSEKAEKEYSDTVKKLKEDIKEYEGRIRGKDRIEELKDLLAQNPIPDPIARASMATGELKKIQDTRKKLQEEVATIRRLEKTLAKLKTEILTGDKPSKKVSDITSPRIEGLKKEVEAARKIRNENNKRERQRIRALSEPQRKIEAAAKQTQRRISGLEAKKKAKEEELRTGIREQVNRRPGAKTKREVELEAEIKQIDVDIKKAHGHKKAYNKKRRSSAAKQTRAQRKKTIRKQVRAKGHKMTKKTENAVDRLLDKMDRGEEITPQAISKAFDYAYGIPHLTELKAKKYKKLSGVVSRTAPGSFARRDATINFFKAIDNDIKGADFVDKLWSVWYANILSGYSTHIRNMGDTALQVVADTTLVSMRWSPVETWQNLEIALFGSLQGAKVGLYEAGRHVKTGESIVGRDSESKYGPRSELERAPFKSLFGIPMPPKWNPFNWGVFVGRLLTAEDTLWFKTAQEARVRIAALDKGRAQGLKGKELVKFVENELALSGLQTADHAEIAKNEWKEMKEGDYNGTRESYIKRRKRELQEKARDGELTEIATEMAKRATYNYQPEGLLGGMSRAVEMLTGVDRALNKAAEKRLGKKGVLAAKALVSPIRLLIPFTRIVANVTNKGLDWTPVGIGRSVFLSDNLTYESGFPKFVPKGIDQRGLELKKGILGTAAMVGLMSRDIEDDDDWQIHGSGTGDYSKDSQLRSTGWIPYSISFLNDKGERVYVSYKNTPLNIALGIIGKSHDDQRYHSDYKDKEHIYKFAYMFTVAANYTLDQSFLSNTRDFLKALDTKGENKQRSIMKMMGRMTSPSQAIPFANLWNNLERDVFDKYVRDTDGYFAGLLASTPVFRHEAKPKLDMLGDPIEARPLGWLFTKGSKDSREAKIWNMMAKKNAFIANPWYYHNKMDVDQYYDFVKKRGQYIKKELTPYKVNSMLKMSDKDAKAQMKKIADEARDKAKKDVGYDK